MYKNMRFDPVRDLSPVALVAVSPFALVVNASYGLFAPAGTPRPILDAINRLVGDFIDSPQMAQKLAAEGSEAAERVTPDQYKASFAREYAEVEGRIRQIKVKLY